MITKNQLQKLKDAVSVLSQIIKEQESIDGRDQCDGGADKVS